MASCKPGRAGLTAPGAGPRRRVEAPLEAVGDAQLLAWLRLELGRGQPAAAWFDPAGDVAWVAAGAAQVLVAPDVSGLLDVSSRLAELVPGTPPGVPVAAVGLAFDPARTVAPADPWAGWPGAWALVPERLVWRRGDRAGMAVYPTTDDGALARLLADLARAPGQERAVGAEVEQVGGETRGAWLARVRRALGDLGPDLDKVVLARAVEHRAASGAFDPVATLARLRDARAVRFAAAPGGAARGCLVGATPELLARVDGARVETVALAGTAARGRDPAEDEALGAALLASAKDRREHALVADAVRAALAARTATVEAPPAPSLRRLPRVQHLETRFTGTLRPAGGLLDLAAGLHPTPAVAGAPRGAALAWLRRHEPLSRGWYAGAVGWLDAQGGGALAVAIRSALLQGDRAFTFAGAGVVAGSDPAAEWDETALKLETLGRALTAGGAA